MSMAIGLALSPVMGGAVPFSPLKFGSDLIAWYDASRAETVILNGSDVSEWRDLSGNDNHASQAVAVNQPLYDAANNKITIDGDNEGLVAALSAAPTHPMFVIAVFDIAGTSSGGEFGRIIDAAADLTPTMYYRDTANKIRISAGSDVEYQTDAEPFSTKVITSLFNGVSSEIWEDGVSKVTGDVGATNFTTAGFTLGNSPSLNRGINGSLAEVIIINKDLTTAEHNQLGNYLAAKRGTTWTNVT